MSGGTPLAAVTSSHALGHAAESLRDSAVVIDVDSLNEPVAADVQPPRRSKRVAAAKKKEESCFVEAVNAGRRSNTGSVGRPRRGGPDVDESRSRSPESEPQDLLEQVRPIRSSKGDPDAPPFLVKVHPSAAAVVQIDAHMTMNEVCGYLAGVVYELPCVEGEAYRRLSASSGRACQPRKVVHILEAVPVRCTSPAELRKQGRSALVEVEMDPESQLTVCERILSTGMLVVGWYHSHPEFCTDPSYIDVENHATHQLHSAHPHLALICSTYWKDLPDSRARLDMFYTRSAGDTDVPYDLPFEICLEPPPEELPGTAGLYHFLQTNLSREGSEGVEGCEGISRPGSLRRALADMQRKTLLEDVLRVADVYSKHSRRTRLNSQWYAGTTHLEKLRQSLHATLCLHPVGSPRGHANLSRSGAKRAASTATSRESSDLDDFEDVCRGTAPVCEVAKSEAADLADTIDSLLCQIGQVWAESCASGSRGGRTGRSGRGAKKRKK